MYMYVIFQSLPPINHIFLIEILSQMNYQSAYQNMSRASSPRCGMLNRKLGEVFSLVCTLGNSNIAITIRICFRVKAVIDRVSSIQVG